MKSRIWMLLVMVLVFVSPILASDSQPRTMFSAQTNTDLMKYPILKHGELTARRAAEMGLHPETIKEPTVVENHFRELVDNDGRMVREILPKGTVVYADATGELIYKADCANRIALVKPCPVCPPAVKARAATASATTAKTSGSFWEDSFFWDVVLALLFLAAIVAALMILAYLLYRLAKRLMRGPTPPPTISPVSDPDPERKFIAFWAGTGSQSKVNFSGYRQVSVAEESGKTTLTFS